MRLWKLLSPICWEEDGQARKHVWFVQVLCICLVCAVLVGLSLLYYNRWRSAIYCAALGYLLFFIPTPWLRDTKEVWRQWWAMDRKHTRRLFLTVFAAALAFCLFAHGFLFANEFFSHDSLSMVNYDFSHAHMLFYTQVGRPLIPLYELIKGPASAPWLIGMLYILWTSLAAVFTVRTLDLKNTLSIVFTTALLCTNTTLAMTGATYVYCMDEYALALLMATAAAWLFCRCRHGWPLGVVCTVASLALYQSYFTTVAALCFFSLIPAVICNEKPLLIIRKGLWYLVLFLASYLFYFGMWSFVCRIMNVAKARMNETIFSANATQIQQKISDTYQYFLHALLRDNGILGKLSPAIGLLFLTALFLWAVGWILDKRIAWGNKALLAAACCLLPIVFQAGYVLFWLTSYSLVSFNSGLLGVFLLLCAKYPPNAASSRRFHAIAVFLALAFVWQNMVFANQIYIKKDLEKNASLSLITRMIERIEQMDGYVLGKTPVAFVGWLPDSAVLSQGRDEFHLFTMEDEGTLTYNYSPSYNVDTYIRYYLNYPMKISFIDSSLEEVQNMPEFPLNESVKWVGDTVVVRLSR